MHTYPMNYKVHIVFVLVLGVVACQKTMPTAPNEDELLDGPMEGLSSAEHVQFLRGDVAFNDDVFTAATGLGPVFVANTCGTCHAGDGKGHPFISFTRFGQNDTTGNKFLHLGGPQLQHKAIPGYEPETLPNGATYSNILAPAITGLGFLDAVPDATILALSDPDDADGDGISGRPNWNTIPEYVTLRPNTITQNGRYVCRFGKKSAAYDLLHQTAGAYNQDMGITSAFEPVDVYSGWAIEPEVSQQTVHDVVLYLKTLKAPIQRLQEDSDVIAGKNIFVNIGCAKCHTPTLRTGPSSINALANKEFYPYTDMLLHDMGAALDDNYTEGYALTSEWKTPALWGLGLSKQSQGGLYYLLHDGRATSIEAAIMLHGGEGQAAADGFKALSNNDKDLLLKFLESL